MGIALCTDSSPLQRCPQSPSLQRAGLAGDRWLPVYLRRRSARSWGRHCRIRIFSSTSLTDGTWIPSFFGEAGLSGLRDFNAQSSAKPPTYHQIPRPSAHSPDKSSSCRTSSDESDIDATRFTDAARFRKWRRDTPLEQKRPALKM